MLENYRIAAPCKVAWESMTGDDHVRFCTSCEKPVFNLTGMRRREAEDLIASHGQICGRLFQRGDGTLMTTDCPEGLRRRTARWVASSLALACLLLFAILTFVGLSARRGAGDMIPLRRFEPMRTIADWLDPPVVMGEICLPPPGQ